MRPSQQAAAVLYYAGITLGLFQQWPTHLFRKIKVKPNDPAIVSFLRELHTLFRGLQNMDLHRALRSKYSHFSLHSVALTPPLKTVPF